MRINGFEQIKGFYSWMFSHQELDIKPQHMSLYMFLVNQNNRNNWVEWFKVPFDLGMSGSCISSKKTYYNCLNDLQDWKLIEYEKGVNTWKAPRVKLEVLKDTATVPQSEPLPIPVATPQHILQLLQVVEPLPIPNIKLLTLNLKLITNNLKQVVTVLGGTFEIDSENENKEQSDLIEYLVKDFGFSEMKFINQKRLIMQFVTNLFFKNEAEHFKIQYESYKEFKLLSGQTSHSFKSLIGTVENQFNDACWNSENWTEKLKTEKLNQNGRNTKKSNGSSRSNQGFDNSNGYSDL